MYGLDKEKQNIDLFNFYKSMINIRKSNKIFIDGDFEEVYCRANIIAFKRVLEDEEVLCVFNNSDSSASISINSQLKAINLILTMLRI
mgnify:CR=1 FL=1